MDENNLKDQDIRLRCIGIAMNVESMKHQHETQKWMRTGTPPSQTHPGAPPVGDAPAPPEMVDIFEAASEVFEYVNQDVAVVSK